jgi:hypothetical protein
LVDEISGFDQAQNLIGLEMLARRLVGVLDPKTRAALHRVSIENVVFAFDSALEDLSEQTESLVNGLRAEWALRLAISVQQLQTIVLRKLELFGLLAQAVAPPENLLVGDFGQPMALELGQDVAAENVTVGRHGVVVEIDAVPIQPECGELMQKWIAIFLRDVRDGRLPDPSLDRPDRLIELEICKGTIPALQLAPESDVGSLSPPSNSDGVSNDPGRSAVLSDLTGTIWAWATRCRGCPPG